MSAAKKAKTGDEFPLPRPAKEPPFMQLALLLMEPNDHHLALASQVGVQEVRQSDPKSTDC